MSRKRGVLNGSGRRRIARLWGVAKADEFSGCGVFARECPPIADTMTLTGERSAESRYFSMRGGFFRLLYTASMNMSVVQGPVFAPKRVS
jgi:hypothetical protein